MELCNRVRLLCFKYENAVLAHSGHQKLLMDESKISLFPKS